jgi:Arc/MetJ family transcription regulator
MAMRKDQKLKSRPKSKQDKSRPASEGPFREEGTVTRVVMPRRWKALPATGAVAALIAERSERDDELADQLARLVAGERRSTAHVENDLGGVRSEKRVRITVTLEDGLIRTAQSYTGIEGKSALIQTALTRLIEGEAARRLAAMGGTMPELKQVPRRRSPAK